VPDRSVEQGESYRLEEKRKAGLLPTVDPEKEVGEVLPEPLPAAP
jgi:hypothetical protein